ncbi:MAG: PCP reductase family protein [Planctomycetota bacterium]|nr:PCP reductase family protein [Planctomycetota bacterium]
MKLVCVSCDEQMKLEENRGPDEGSLTMMFSCAKCGNKTSILTNPMETQMVRSLGVEICPAGAQSTPEPMGLLKGALVSQRDGALGDDVPWTEAATSRLERVPGFVRPMVKMSIVKFAREKGYEEITEAVMDEAKTKMI